MITVSSAMKTLESPRLILRKFRPDDLSAVQSYAGNAENIIYMLWGPNTTAQTQWFIDMAIREAEKEPCTHFEYAAVCKKTGQLIGACGLYSSGETAEIGWILHKAYWKQGYGTEMGRALLDFGFGELKLHRIIAHCDAENYGSYRVMEKIGMRREGLFLEGRPAHKGSDKEYGDELSYAILRTEWSPLC